MADETGIQNTIDGTPTIANQRSCVATYGDYIVRFLAFIATLVAFTLMAISVKQTKIVPEPINIEAKWKSMPALVFFVAVLVNRFFVAVNLAACFYLSLSLLIKSWGWDLADAISLCFLCSLIGAAVTIDGLSFYGNSYMQWKEETYCFIGASIILSIFAAVSFGILLARSAKRLRKRVQ